eukprot:m.173848 g.173848  ORF g.173848 m.173848 type:complete len:838 (-) comp15313_c3_seq12:23-2536(-)
MDRSISFACKRTEPAQLDKLILEHIRQRSDGSGAEGLADYSVALAEFAQLRTSSLEKAPAANDYNLKALLRYYGQLLSAIKRFPFCTDETKKVETLATKFTWSEVFEGTGLFKKSSNTLRTVRFEQACVLFNIAATQSQIAAGLALTTDEARKQAAMALQGAAVILRHLQQQSAVWLPACESLDLQPPLLGGLSELMLAQAQEVFWFKCTAEKRAPELLSKIAAQAADYFAAAHASLAARAEIDKAWLAQIAAKRLFFLADAQLQAGKAAIGADHGVVVARLRAARAMAVQLAKGSLGASERVATLLSQATAAAESAERENNVIHLKIVPDINTVEPLPKMSLATFEKPLPDFTSPDLLGHDLFAGLTPTAVLASVKTYQERRAAAVAELVARLRECTATSVATLRDMGLPGALEASTGDAAVPPALLTHAAAVREGGGLDAITTKIESNRAEAGNCHQVLRDAEARLDEEQRDYETLATRHGDRWKQQASVGLTEKTRADLAKYRDVLSRSATSDETVATKLAAARDGILLLSKPPEVLASLLPAARPAQGAHPAETELRAALAALDRVRTQRDELEKQIGAPESTSITQELLDCSSKNVAEASVIEAHLALLEPHRQRVSALVAESGAALDAVMLANQQYVQSRGSGAAVTERERMITDLTAAYETFVEVTANLTEGQKFYTNLSAMLSKFAAKVNDFTASRATEREQLLKEINRTILQAPADPLPAPMAALSLAPTPTPAPAPGYGNLAGMPPLPPAYPPQATVPQSHPAPAPAPAASATPTKAVSDKASQKEEKEEKEESKAAIAKSEQASPAQKNPSINVVPSPADKEKEDA